VNAEMVLAFISSPEYRERFRISNISSFSLSANPNPIIEAPCAGCGAGSTDKWAVTDLAIQETGGVAGTVTSIGLTLVENGSNTVIASGEFDAGGVVFFAGSNRLPGNNGLVAHNIGVHYPQSFAGRFSTETYTVHITDDNGTQITSTFSIQVTP